MASRSDDYLFETASEGSVQTFQTADSRASVPNVNCYSEFPSLSGAPQPQYQNPGQAVWANANQRAVQHTPVQRPQQQSSITQQGPNQQSQQTQQSQDQTQQSRDDAFPASSQFQGGADDYHHGGQSGVGQLGGAGQPQPSSIEEFPPLGRNGNDESQQDRRGSLMQNAAFGGFPNSSVFSLPTNQAQGRPGVPSALGSQSESGRSSTLVDRTMSPRTLGFGGGQYISFEHLHGPSAAKTS